MNKNNLYVGKDKISLNYQTTFKDKMIHHGILFVDTNISYMNMIHNHITTDLVNMKKFFKQQMTVSMFRVLFLHELLEGEIGNKVYKLDNLDLVLILLHLFI